MKTNHSIIIQWSEIDKVFIASIPEISGLNAFGDTPEEAIKELGVAKRLFLRTMKEDGEKIPEPDVYIQHSGQLRIRIPKSLHSSLSQEAKKEGISLNSYISHLLSERNAFQEIKKEIEKINLLNLSQKIISTGQTSGKPLFVPDKAAVLLESRWGAYIHNEIAKVN
mgnify:CR=1 FL=1